MTITVQATYEDGVLKPATPLQLAEHQQVEVVIRTPKVQKSSDSKPTRSIADESYGMLKWTGDPETLRKLIEDPEYGIMESP